MKFICYHHWDQLPLNSRALFTNAEQDSLFFSQAWFENLIETVLDDQQNNHQKLLLACVIDDDVTLDIKKNTNQNTNKQPEIFAILPLITRDNKEWTSLCHAYSALYSLILSEKDQDAVLACLCKGLIDLPFDYLTIQPVAEDNQHINSFREMMESSGFNSYRHFRAYNWFHQTKGQTYLDYRESRPSQVRNTIARKQRKLHREHGYKIRLHIDNDIEEALTNYHKLYHVSWKANEQYESIVRGFTDKASTSGWTRLGILTVNNQAVAAHLWYVVGRKASIFRLVYDQRWKQYSPGSILMAYMMEYVIDTDKVEEIDFLSGNDHYKQDWMSERRERIALTFVKTEQHNHNNRDKLNLFTRTIKKLNKLRY